MSCMPDFRLRADRRCKQLAHLSIALQEDEFHFSMTEQLRLPVLLACLVEDLLQLEVDAIEQTNFAVDKRANATIAVDDLSRETRP